MPFTGVSNMLEILSSRAVASIFEARTMAFGCMPKNKGLDVAL
jgi:hypothetical protein